MASLDGDTAAYAFEVVERFEEPLFTALARELLGPGAQPPEDDGASETREARRQAWRPPGMVRIAVRGGGEFVGWTCGWQDGSSRFYMAHSAILPAHRRQGLYTELVRQVLALARAEGYTEVWSRHRTDNNPVIVAKLKLGFTIQGLDLTSPFGPLVHLAIRLD